MCNSAPEAACGVLYNRETRGHHHKPRISLSMLAPDLFGWLTPAGRSSRLYLLRACSDGSWQVRRYAHVLPHAQLS